MDLDRWVNDTNPDEQLQYSKGWWDYIELIRRLMYKFGAKDAQVVATYSMRTPRPEEDLVMPAVQFAVGSTEFIVKYDFGVYPERWTVSVKNAIAVVRPILGLFDDKQDLRDAAVAGFDAEWIHGSYHNDSTCFTCEIHDEWDLSPDQIWRIVLDRYFATSSLKRKLWQIMKACPAHPGDEKIGYPMTALQSSAVRGCTPQRLQIFCGGRPDQREQQAPAQSG